jgi:hypothetical protein
MLVIIENVYFSTRSFCSNYVILLRHVAGSVNLSLMVDLTVDLNAFILSFDLVPAHSACLLVGELDLIYSL